MTDPDNTSSTSSERRLSRYHRLAARKKAQERSDAKFFRIVFLLAAISAALAIGLGVMFLNTTV